MNAPFEPIGELARWRVLVDEFRNVARGTTLTYDELGESLDLDPVKDRRAIQAAVGQASKALSRDHERSLVAVRGVGYRVALPDEHIDLAGRQQRKSRNAIVRARRHVDHVDLSGMDEITRSAFHAAARVLAYQEGQIRRLDLRQKDLESAVESVTTKVERIPEDTAARLAELERQIAELNK
jgi:hypothetical protein